MNYELCQQASDNILESIWKELTSEYREGIHVSDLIGCLRKPWARIALGVNPAPSTATTLLWEIGRKLEPLLLTAEPGQKIMTGEDCFWTKDGIIGRTDGLIYYPRTIVIECKATFKSAKKGLNDSPHYAMQAACYCHMLGTTEAQIRVLHLSGLGGYGPPQIKVYECSWEREELARIWAELVMRKKTLLDAVDNKKPPTTLHHWGFECPSCAIKKEIGCHI